MDVIGVVSSVSRMERFDRYQCETEFAEGGSHIMSQYDVFRWIELVDESVVNPIPLVGFKFK